MRTDHEFESPAMREDVSYSTLILRIALSRRDLAPESTYGALMAFYGFG